jgi:hypothetical protein
MQDKRAAARAALAGQLAHDANNLIGKLYAASSWLEDPQEPDAIEETRLALNDAVASATALQSVLYLLSLTPAPCGHDAGPASLFSLSAQAQLFATLREVAGVHSPEPSVQWASLSCSPDFDTVRAVLVCAARLLRRQAGHQAVLHASLCALPHGRWQLALSASDAGPPASRDLNRAETQALEHAAQCLNWPELQWATGQTSAGLWQLTLPGDARGS